MKSSVTQFMNVIILIKYAANTNYIYGCEKTACNSYNSTMDDAITLKHKGEKRKLSDDNKNNSSTYIPNLVQKSNNVEKIVEGGEILEISDTFINDIFNNNSANYFGFTEKAISEGEYKLKSQHYCSSTEIIDAPSTSNIHYFNEDVNYPNCFAEQTTPVLDRQQNVNSDEAATVHLNYTTNSSFKHCYALDTTQRNPNISIFFHTTVNVLKNVLYYRFNISKFFYFFNKQMNKNLEIFLKNYNGSKDLVMKDFIAHSIQFAKAIESRVDVGVVLIDEDEYQQMKGYEKWLINEVNLQKNFDELKNCMEYKAIKEYNKNYLLSLNKNTKKCGFYAFYTFLLPFFNTVPISKYFCMIQNLVKSIYDLNLIINERCNQHLQNHLLDIGAFEVNECCCRKEVKQNFLFHWGYCWCFYFTRVCKLPDYNSSDVVISDCITNYPQAFFIQAIALVHIVISSEDNYIAIRDFDKDFMLLFKQTIQELLFLSVNEGMKSIFHTNLHNLFIAISNIYNHKIYQNYLVTNIRIIQTSNENFTLSNKLIPELQKLVDGIFHLAKESYQKTNLKISDIRKLNKSN